MKTKIKKKTLFFDRALASSLGKQALILFIILILLFGISFALLYASGANWMDFCTKNHIRPWMLPLYLLIDTNALNNIYIDECRTPDIGFLMASSIIYVLGVIVFNGALISIIVNYVSNRTQRHRQGLIHYIKEGHYVIMGYDDMVPSIITGIFNKDDEAKILLLSSLEAPIIREKLKQSVARKSLDNVIINYGHRQATEYYKDIHLETAKEIYIVGKRELPTHDAVNVECVMSICEYLKPFSYHALPKRIICLFENLDTYKAFKTTEIFTDVMPEGVEFVPYNFYTGWAVQIMTKGEYSYKGIKQNVVRFPLLYRGFNSPNQEKYVHLVFFGMSNFAVSFAMEAAQIIHLPKCKNGEIRKTRITFVEMNADKEMNVFIARNKHLFDMQSYLYYDLSNNDNIDGVFNILQNDENKFRFRLNDENTKPQFIDFLDVEFEFVKADVMSVQVQRLLKIWADDSQQIMSVFIATQNEKSNFEMAMNLPDTLYYSDVPVFVRQDHSDTFIFKLRNADNNPLQGKPRSYAFVDDMGKLHTQTNLQGKYANIYPFGMNNIALDVDEDIICIAKLVNFLYCHTDMTSFNFNDQEINNLTDSQIFQKAEELWQSLSIANKWSNLYNAYNIKCKLDIIRHIKNLSENDDCLREIENMSHDEINMMAEVEHNRWNIEKLMLGFRVPQPNEDKYNHPDHNNELAKNKTRFIHHDIRPFNKLDQIRNLDVEYIKHLPWIVNKTKAWTGVLRNNM